MLGMMYVRCVDENIVKAQKVFQFTLKSQYHNMANIA